MLDHLHVLKLPLLKFLPHQFESAMVCLKAICRMANSADPDQTAPLGSV